MVKVYERFTPSCYHWLMYGGGRKGKNKAEQKKIIKNSKKYVLSNNLLGTI